MKGVNSSATFFQKWLNTWNNQPSWDWLDRDKYFGSRQEPSEGYQQETQATSDNF